MTILFVQALETRLSRNSGYSWTRTNIFRVRSDTAWEDPKTVVFAAAGGPFEEGTAEPPEPQDPLTHTWVWSQTETTDSGDVLITVEDEAQEVTDVDCRLENPRDRRLWLVTFTYHDWLFERQGQQIAVAKKPGEPGRETPLDEEPVWLGSYFSTEELKTLTVADAAGDREAVINSAEQPYPEQRLPVDYETIVLQSNVKQVPSDIRRDHVNTTNEAAFWGFDADELKLARWSVQPRYYARKGTDGILERVSYCRQRMEFHVKKGGWSISHPDYGTVKLDSAGNADPAVRYETIDFKDTVDRLLPGTNVLLNGSGAFDTTQTTVHAANVRGPFQFLVQKNFTDLQEWLPDQLPEQLESSS